MEPSNSGLGSHGARVASPQSPILRVTWALYHVWKKLPKIVYTKLLTLPGHSELTPSCKVGIQREAAVPVLRAPRWLAAQLSAHSAKSLELNNLYILSGRGEIS